MGKVKELNIKNRTYYSFNDMINIKNFHSNLLKIDRKPYKDDDIYYIGYIMIKLIQQKNIKKFFLELNQKQKRLIVEQKSFMKKIMAELELIQMMIYL